MENRVLTLEEVLALAEGAEVWVEEITNEAFESAVNHIYTFPSGEKTVMTMNCAGFYSLTDPFCGGVLGKNYRVWSLPQPPTPAELAANPWP